MLTLLLGGVAVAALSALLERRLGDAAAWLLALWPASLFVLATAQLPAITAGATMVERTVWVPSLGIDLVLVLDGLSLLFVLLITGLGVLVTIYAGSYLGKHPLRGRFLGILLVFMTSMLGLVLAGDVITLFVFWEGTSIASYLLIGFDHERESARRSALQALLVTGGGGLALLGGFLLLGQVVGSYEIAAAQDAGDAVRESPFYLAILGLVLLGAFTKSAQVPFHFWLPNAMAGPTPVSAYLHSATMVKAGVYLLARMDMALGGTLAWVYVVAGVGAITMLVGAVGSVLETDLKRVLAQSTIAALGTLVALIGLSFDASIKAMVVFLVVHALYKGALFMVTGSVDHEAGSRDATVLGNLRRSMPLTAVAAILAGLSMAGLPPLFGFVGKELAYKAKLGMPGFDTVLPAVAVATNALTIAAAAIIVVGPFFARRSQLAKPPHEAPPGMRLGPLVLAGAGLVLGLWPSLIKGLVGRAVESVLGHEMPIKLALWYGVGPALYLSIGTVVLGVIAYVGWRRLVPTLTAARGILTRDFERTYDVALTGTLVLAGRVSSTLMRGGVGRHLAWILGAAMLLTGWAGWRSGGWRLASDFEISWATASLSLAIVVSVAAVLATRSRLVALLSLGGVGTALALVFLVAGAIDLAITQLLVETVFLVAAVLLLRRLPRTKARVPARHRVLAASLAALSGTGVALLLLGVVAVPFDGTVAQYFADQSVPAGYGRNIVNVILVDFRAIDTLGEITVVAIAALGLTLLLSRSRSAKEASP
jgi:multicomponent Na+:H+ antiporter subunit A